MTHMLTIRVHPDLLAKAEARAAQLGMDRGKYVRDLIERDLAQTTEVKRRFASEDFIGSIQLAAGPYTNRRVREKVRARLLGKREKNR